MSRTTCGFSRFLLTVAGILFLFATLRPAGAVPVFSRKYQTSCQTCHVAFPKLNPFGQAFRLNGYRMPGEAENPDLVKEVPVSLGSEAYERVWPDAVYPGTIPAHVPLAFNVKMADVYASSRTDTGTEIIHNDFQFPQEANLFAAGTMGRTFSFLGEVTYAENPDGSSSVEIERAQLHVNSPFGPPHLINFKIGKFAADLDDGFHEMWLLTNNGVDSLFTFNPIGFNGGSALAEDGGGVSLPQNVKGLEMYGVAAHRFFYTVGVVNGIGPGTNGTHDANSRKDVYARVDYKFGGMGLDGDTKGVNLPPENWRETSLRLGLLGYLGDGSNILFPVTDADGNPFQIEDRRYDRVGLYASLILRDLNLFGVAVHGTDSLRLHDNETGDFISERKRSYDAWFAQADYVIKPPFLVSLRYEHLRPADPQALVLKSLNANFTYLVRANVKTMLEYHRDLRDGKNYEIDGVLRFAY
jgi:hypothetical protein